ncbi:MAG TPA: GMC family oxidoreductase [Polyangiaceae bacterium]|jgi:cholesterol oxidase|nr:GMC family oxidoreductase [Polyangiaceae bacterium]
MPNTASAVPTTSAAPAAGFDYDFAIVGSGFGGSVSALRLSEKGYSVAVLEMGKRWRTEDFPETNWNLRKSMWRPAQGMYGILQLTVLRDVFILHGCGVGGGSLVYANTLLVPPDEAFRDPQWVGIDWKKALLPHYDTALRMLGAVPSEVLVETDRMLKRVADQMGRGHTFHRATVGVHFGEAGVTVPDPYFGGEGPERTGCTLCGGCMVGCRYGSKNTLDKNYLHLAEQRGTRIVPESRVIDVRALEGGGYELTIEKSTGLRHPRSTLRARNVVVSAGSLGTVELLMRCKERGSLPRLSKALGTYVRTNSEALLGVRSRRNDIDYSRGIAITSGVYVDEKTHVECVRYGAGSDALAPLATLLTDGGPPWPRWMRWVGEIARHPASFLRTLVPFGAAKRGVILLVMQPIDSHMRYVLRRSKLWPFGKVLDTERGEAEPVPVYFPIAQQIAKRMAEEMDGIPQSGIIEVLLDKATTAHILGGCPIGESPDTGVVDTGGRAFGHEGLYVVDGSIIPANLGVNPSLTITAMAEHAMSRVPPKPGAVQRPAAVPPRREARALEPVA